MNCLSNKIIAGFFVVYALTSTAAADFTCTGKTAGTSRNYGVTLQFSEAQQTVLIKIDSDPPGRLPSAKTLNIKLSEELGRTSTIYASGRETAIENEWPSL
jgi:hypothetical protein